MSGRIRVSGANAPKWQRTRRLTRISRPRGPPVGTPSRGSPSSASPSQTPPGGSPSTWSGSRKRSVDRSTANGPRHARLARRRRRLLGAIHPAPSDRNGSARGHWRKLRIHFVNGYLVAGDSPSALVGFLDGPRVRLDGVHLSVAYDMQLDRSRRPSWCSARWRHRRRRGGSAVTEAVNPAVLIDDRLRLTTFTTSKRHSNGGASKHNEDYRECS